MLSLGTKYAILDEVDSGLDKESLKLVGKVVKKMSKKGCGFLVISHGEKLLEYLKLETRKPATRNLQFAIRTTQSATRLC